MSIHDIPGVLAFRFLPFLGYFTFSRGVSLPKRLAAWGIFVLFVFLAILGSADLGEVLVRSPLALVYFAAVSLGLYELRRLHRPSWVANAVAFTLCAGAYVLAPVLAFRGVLMVATVGVGWDAMLSAYSFLLDYEKRTPPSRTDCLFFILVNPCLVYTNRGRKTQDRIWARRAFRRFSLGVLAWVGLALLQNRFALVRAGASNGYSRFLITCGGAAIALYLAHAGLASIQIAFARMAGHEIPERYVYPLVSRGPEDFWRRWNTYVGDWIRRYAFYPLARGARRAWPKLPRALWFGVSIVGSFLVVGFLHDYALWAERAATSGDVRVALALTPAFSIFAAVLIVWHGAVAGLREIGARSAFVTRVPPAAWSVVSWLCFVHVAFGMAWLVQSGGLSF